MLVSTFPDGLGVPRPRGSCAMGACRRVPEWMHLGARCRFATWGPHKPSEPLQSPEQEAAVGAERTQGGALATSKTHRGAALGLGGIRLASV